MVRGLCTEGCAMQGAVSFCCKRWVTPQHDGIPHSELLDSLNATLLYLGEVRPRHEPIMGLPSALLASAMACRRGMCLQRRFEGTSVPLLTPCLRPSHVPGVHS